MLREYQCAVETGAPQVAYREAISRKAEFNYTHKKQSGGSGQYARVAGYVEPLDEDSEETFEFESKIRGGSIPTEYIQACGKGFEQSMAEGKLIGFPVVGVRVVIDDGQSHSVDSSDMAFQLASKLAFKEVYNSAKPVVLEPIMKLEVEGPTEFQGAYVKTIMQRRGAIAGTTEEDGFVRVTADVPLAEMFGYSTDLRSCSQGKAEFTMEFAKYSPVPNEVQKELVEKHQKELEAKRK
jgi:elongation factor G